MNPRGVNAIRKSPGRGLIGVHDAVRDHPGVQSWYARS